MAKSTKNVPARKPIKARGALPAPRVAPRRVKQKWYQIRGFQVLGVIVILGVLGIGLKTGLDFKKAIDDRKDKTRQVRLFESNLKLLQAPMQDVFSAINGAPPEYVSGKLSAEEFKKQTDAWLEALTKMDSGIRKRSIPASFKSLVEVRGLLVRGSVIYIDAAKSFQLAALVADQTHKELAIKEGYNLMTHASSVFGMGQRALEKLKSELKITKSDGTDILGPIDLPPVEAPPPQPPAAQTIPGQTGGIPGGVPGGVPVQPSP